MYTVFDTQDWSRKETFDYFRAFGFPFVNICLNQDISILLQYCKEQNVAISHALHFCSLCAANETQAFRLRFKDGEVVLFEKVDGGATVLLDDQSIRFCLYPYVRSFAGFSKLATENELHVRAAMQTDPRTSELGVVHYSILPWISFTSISHPRSNKPGDSIPKISFGKYFKEAGRALIPVSIEVNHALMDGFHISQYLEVFNRKMEELATGFLQ